MRERALRLRRWSSRHRLVLGAIGGGVCFVALAYVVLKLAPQWFADTEGLEAKDRVTARQGVRTAALALLAGGLAVIGSFYTARTFALNRAGHLTDRFTKAIEQLGHLTVDVRLGGIYALERIARDSKDDHPQVVEVLTAYVREHAPRTTPTPAVPPGSVADANGSDTPARTRLDTDVQAALTVLGRRRLEHEQDSSPALDLANTELTRARLVRLHLIGANLSGANLIEANLIEANLGGADLGGADLSGAYLVRANLDRAIHNSRTVWPDGFDVVGAGMYET